MHARIGTPVLCLLFVATPVFGLENIDNVYWFLDASFPSSDRTTSWFAFDADLTSTDRAEGLTFTLAEWDASGLPATPVFHCVLDDYADLPLHWKRIHLTSAFSFYCDASGRLLPIGLTTWINYCDPADTTMTGSVQGVGRGFIGSGFPIEQYEFTLVDEHGNLAANPTPENAYTPCRVTPGISAGSEAGALKELTRLRSAQIQASQKPGESGSVGLYFDSEGTICSGTIEPGIPQKIYVIAKTRGLTECGFAGAEFRLTGIPESWQVSPVPRPDIVSFGDPLAEGATLALSCQRPTDDQLILYEVEVLATRREENVTFELQPHTNPVGVFACPLLVLCDFPFFTQVCVESIPCHFNAASAKSCDGAVATQNQTWSMIKQIYRR